MKSQHTEILLDVKKSYAGLGLFAHDAIKKGARIIEYVGDKISSDEANKRGGKYLFEVNSKWTIDGSDRKNKARYINHSCGKSANCEAEINKGRIFIFAKRNIDASEELTYDYGEEYFNEHIKPFGCRCKICTK